MQEPATALWGLSISDADFEKLKAGFEPRDMDDKWRVSVTNQNGDGNISVTFNRGWTDKEYYILVMKPSDGDSSNSDVKIEAITWEQRKGRPQRSEEQAKKEVVILARCNLACEFDALPEYIPRM